MATIPRKQAPRLARPAMRYWKGKAPKGVADIESDSDMDEQAHDELEEQREDADVLIKEAGNIVVGVEEEEEEEEEEAMQLARVAGKASMSVALKDVNISKEGNVIVAGRLESGRTEVEREESEEEEEEEEEGGPRGVEDSEEESSEYESESEEEAPKYTFRPVFVPKRARVTIAEKETFAEHSEEMRQKREQEAEERREQSHNMVAESIRRELAEKEKEEQIPDVDDTDGLDPVGEFEAWRLRELSRIKKEKEEVLLREEERQEIERRRALPEEQRLKEDMERAERTRTEKPKGKQKFLQKYWHKGAFHQNDEVLARHDYTEATESTIDVTLLPKVMQVKNFGKRSRTKYTHLLDQDTTVGTGGFGGTAPVKQGGTGTDTGSCFLCGGPHLKKDCPQSRKMTGANSITTNSRPYSAGHGGDQKGREDYRSKGKSGYQDASYRWRDDDRYKRGGRDGRDTGRYGVDRRDRYNESRDRESYRRSSRSRSRSPFAKDRYQTKEKRRSRERSVDERYQEKKRRLN